MDNKINERFVSVGIVSLRDPITNARLEGVPVYIRETDYHADERKIMDAFCDDLTDMFKVYVRSGGLEKSAKKGGF